MTEIKAISTWPPFRTNQFTSDRKLCIVTHLQEYINRTKEIRGSNSQLFLSYIKPFRPVTKATIARWVKMVLNDAGIDISTYSAHSSRAAATSHAKQQGLSLSEIMKTAGWTSSSVFERFYHKPKEQMESFGEVVLKNKIID